MDDYYHTCPFPKPTVKKKKRKVNGWKDKPNRICYYCGKRGAERHEVFGGPWRQTSIDHGFQVDVCTEHHRMLHESASEFSKEETMKWRRHYQRLYEEKLTETGIGQEQARMLWIQLIGRNYL